ncbi:hypothetical protein PInf_025441 [Phytophthora infestans]|nr:hypothetical protein PInf_025441 [Phytophthora infestans]
MSCESFLSRLKELHRSPLFGSSSEESEEDDSDGLRAVRPPSPTPSASDLFDNDSDEEPEPVGGLNRLRRSTDPGDWHPFALPPVPAKHPANGRVNHYDPAARWDYSVPVNGEQLHDVRGEYLHRSAPWCIRQYYKKYFVRRDQASSAKDCFMDAFCAALYHLGETGLASTATELWVGFEPSTVDGVSRAEAKKFFRCLQRSDFPLDYDLLFQSPLDASYMNVERFQAFIQTLREGVYLTSTDDGLVGHCVVALAKGPDTAVSVLDGVESPVTPEPLTNLEYIDKVKWMGLMKLSLGYRCRSEKRKSRPNRKKDRREKKKQQKL